MAAGATRRRHVSARRGGADGLRHDGGLRLVGGSIRAANSGDSGAVLPHRRRRLSPGRPDLRRRRVVRSVAVRRSPGGRVGAIDRVDASTGARDVGVSTCRRDGAPTAKRHHRRTHGRPIARQAVRIERRREPRRRIATVVSHGATDSRTAESHPQRRSVGAIGLHGRRGPARDRRRGRDPRLPAVRARERATHGLLGDSASFSDRSRRDACRTVESHVERRRGGRTAGNSGPDRAEPIARIRSSSRSPTAATASRTRWPRRCSIRSLPANPRGSDWGLRWPSTRLVSMAGKSPTVVRTTGPCFLCRLTTAARRILLKRRPAGRRRRRRRRVRRAIDHRIPG